jgi:hypothetical protein
MFIIIEILNIVGLEMLNCSECPLLTAIPHITGLEHLNCSCCRLLLEIPHIVGFKTFYCRRCPWLDHADNLQYPVNVARLGFLQTWFRACLLGRQLERLIPMLMPLYYHPDAHGGYVHKRDMTRMISDL